MKPSRLPLLRFLQLVLVGSMVATLFVFRAYDRAFEGARDQAAFLINGDFLKYVLMLLGASVISLASLVAASLITRVKSPEEIEMAALIVCLCLFATFCVPGVAIFPMLGVIYIGGLIGIYVIQRHTSRTFSA